MVAARDDCLRALTFMNNTTAVMQQANQQNEKTPVGSTRATTNIFTSVVIINPVHGNERESRTTQDATCWSLNQAQDGNSDTCSCPQGGKRTSKSNRKPLIRCNEAASRCSVSCCFAARLNAARTHVPLPTSGPIGARETSY